MATHFNQKNQPVEEVQLFEPFGDEATLAEVQLAIGMLAKRMGLSFYRTTATKHGTPELDLRETD